MSISRLAPLILVLALASVFPACGGGGNIDEEENIGPGPGLAMVSHTGVAWSGYLPLWSVWSGEVLYADGSNLLEYEQVLIELPGLPEGAEVIAYGFNTLGVQITFARGFLGPMGVVLQMP